MTDRHGKIQWGFDQTLREFGYMGSEAAGTDCGKRLICVASDLVDGGDGVRFTIDGPQSALPAFAIRHEGTVYAYRNACAHVSVELDWNPRKFFDDSGLYLICATHGALYEPATGHCIDGPCRGASLYAIAIEECNGNIYLKSDQ